MNSISRSKNMLLFAKNVMHFKLMEAKGACGTPSDNRLIYFRVLASFADAIALRFSFGRCLRLHEYGLPAFGFLPFDLYHRPQSSDSINSLGKTQRFHCCSRSFLIAPGIPTAAAFSCPADSTHRTRICACTAHDGYNTSRNLMNICDVGVRSAVERAAHSHAVSFCITCETYTYGVARWRRGLVRIKMIKRK